jgi:AcrR family transcriptional regulator
MNKFIDKRIQRSKEILKTTLIDLLEHKDFNDISVTEIVKMANYNRGTFYNNFGTKEYLLDEVIQDTLDELKSEIRKPYNRTLKVNLMEMKPEDISVFHYFIKEQRLYSILLSVHIRVDFRHQLAKTIEELFIKEYQFEIPEQLQLDSSWLYVYKAHGVAAVMIRWLENGCIEKPEEMSKQILLLMVTSTSTFINKNLENK